MSRDLTRYDFSKCTREIIEIQILTTVIIVGEDPKKRKNMYTHIYIRADT